MRWYEASNIFICTVGDICSYTQFYVSTSVSNVMNPESHSVRPKLNPYNGGNATSNPKLFPTQ